MRLCVSVANHILEKNQCRLYKDLSWTWPIISPPEDYIEETEQECQIIRQYSQIEVKTLLDLGCGGGHNDYTFKKFFELTGVDLSEPMLSLARRLNPEATYLSGDMRDVRLGAMFDTVVIEDAISYMLTENDLRAAFTTAFAHLKPGGVFLTFAEVTKESFQQNRTEHLIGTQDNIEIVFTENHYDPDPTDSVYEITFVYLIRRGGKLEIETDHHLGGIFHVETWMRLLKDVGFEVKQIALAGYDFPTFVCLKSLERR